MSEIINAFPIDNINTLIPMDRKQFYKEQVIAFEKDGKPTMAVEIVNIFLFNESGEFILQKRAGTKGHNANLLDKSVGGHVTNGDNPNFTVMLETVQELQVPSIVLKTHNDFLKTYFLLKDYIKSTSIIEHLDTQITHIPKIINGKEIIIANKTHLYMGIYGGSLKNVDREARGVLFYDIDELKLEINSIPNLFTNDLKYFLKKYENNFREFIKMITTE